MSSLPVQWVPGIHLFLCLQGIIKSLCYHIHLLLFGFLGSSSGLHACIESIFYPLSYFPGPHWKGSLQTHNGEKGNLIGKKKVFLDKVLPYGFSTNTPIMTCCEKKNKKGTYTKSQAPPSRETTEGKHSVTVCFTAVCSCVHFHGQA